MNRDYADQYLQCRYCLGGYCKSEDVQPVELRTQVGGKWDGGLTTAGKKCREYLHGQFRYARKAKRK